MNQDTVIPISPGTRDNLNLLELVRQPQETETSCYGRIFKPQNVSLLRALASSGISIGSMFVLTLPYGPVIGITGLILTVCDIYQYIIIKRSFPLEMVSKLEENIEVLRREKECTSATIQVQSKKIEEITKQNIINQVEILRLKELKAIEDKLEEMD